MGGFYRKGIRVLVPIFTAITVLLASTIALADSASTESINGGQIAPNATGGATYDPTLEKPSKQPPEPIKAEKPKKKAKQDKKSTEKKQRSNKRKAKQEKKKKKKKQDKSRTTDGPFFPVNGEHNFGGEDAKFGAGRGDHSHQGQDIMAVDGTPIVAPTNGKVLWRAYQKDGAGYYLVIESSTNSQTYVFMHLKEGSILVNEGDFVKANQRIADLGETGRAEGPHLHFEIWIGGWYQPGGAPVDPLPYLKKWDKYS